MAQAAVRQISYIFEGCGGVRDQLEQTILNELRAADYPLSATVKRVKAGKGLVGALVGTKEQCVVIDVLGSVVTGFDDITGASSPEVRSRACPGQTAAATTSATAPGRP